MQKLKEAIANAKTESPEGNVIHGRVKLIDKARIDIAKHAGDIAKVLKDSDDVKLMKKQAAEIDKAIRGFNSVWGDVA